MIFSEMQVFILITNLMSRLGFMILLLMSIGFHSYAQDNNIHFKEIPLRNARLLSADPTGNVYVATRNELILINRADTVFKRFSNLSLGTLSTLDASNSMKALLYYRDQAKIQFLDNTASELSGPISLHSFGLEQAMLACISFDNGFWVWLPSSFSLHRFNQQAQSVINIKNIQQLTGLDQFNPITMRERNNMLYLSDPESGIQVFDVFGGYVKKIPIAGIEHFRVLDERLLFQKDNSLFSYHLLLHTIDTLQFPTSNPIDFDVSSKKLYLLFPDMLRIYSLGDK